MLCRKKLSVLSEELNGEMMPPHLPPADMPTHCSEMLSGNECVKEIKMYVTTANTTADSSKSVIV